LIVRSRKGYYATAPVTTPAEPTPSGAGAPPR
jgi:hypothetical protein